jgi:phage shock protein C
MGRRHRGKRRHQQRSFARKQRDFTRRKRSGWGMNMYRNTRDGKIAGVCAGLADHWEIEHWVVRLLAVVAFIFTGSLAFWAYIAGWVVLSPRRRATDYVREEDDEVDLEDEHIEMEYDERHHNYRPRKMFRYGESASVRLQRARERMDAALRRVEDMETYVTSRQYDLNKEFSKL